MAEFLTTQGISFHLENLILNAQKKLVLVSPYLQTSKTLYERLKDSTSRGVQVKIIYGKDELKPNQRNSLAELENLELYYFENLHAKCYFNEWHMIITSMNMYEFSEKNNREMGVLIDRKLDTELFNKAVNETLSIVQSAEHIPLKAKLIAAKKEKTATKPQKRRGYCIRCETRIDYNPKTPYCKDCYQSWSYWENFDFEENSCHKCGQYIESTMNKPECYTCYKESRSLG
ncbi:phospholipase D family protein [Flammeovirga kamogawensis]|uniref:Phospholipase D family protein n=1 Tax=Flammeovirga kamogawensis TaxID=373891 RepID=A0ABX8H4D8_9BACT|nr:phospholipase D family protein [Flammeovirga kamogawensis]MBB6460466.1 phosphatidylserine/phosphatidylglycerophosphate/cardiolipin synthase-like enzyme [Flammeovirga kamogawensis]QWG10272.1 phospholipase D family protein [Flammeovirga kamogawensis]TRX64720.1 hypothetical protein EO216_19475 [Flammeovirga kamogawensis]